MGFRTWKAFFVLVVTLTPGVFSKFFAETCQEKILRIAGRLPVESSYYVGSLHRGKAFETRAVLTALSERYLEKQRHGEQSRGEKLLGEILWSVDFMESYWEKHPKGFLELAKLTYFLKLTNRDELNLFRIIRVLNRVRDAEISEALDPVLRDPMHKYHFRILQIYETEGRRNPEWAQRLLEASKEWDATNLGHKLYPLIQVSWRFTGRGTQGASRGTLDAVVSILDDPSDRRVPIVLGAIINSAAAAPDPIINKVFSLLDKTSRGRKNIKVYRQAIDFLSSLLSFHLVSDGAERSLDSKHRKEWISKVINVLEGQLATNSSRMTIEKRKEIRARIDIRLKDSSH